MKPVFFQLQQVSKTFRKGFFGRKYQALDAIDFSIFAGEAVGFVGHNGAGKSSTIRIMLGLQPPTAGSAQIRGEPATSPSARKGVAYVSEVPLVYDHLTPNELLSMSLSFHGYGGNVISQREYWLERMRLSEVADKRVRGFSKGMTQRVALAMALCADPEALVLDEPLSGLDPIGRREVVDVLEEFRQAGKTLFFSSHVLSDVERLADRFLFIHRGHLKASIEVDSVLRLASNSYEVIVLSDSVLEGYERIGRNQWRQEVEGEAVPEIISAAVASGASLYSVRSALGLEKLYMRLTDEAER